LDKNRNRSGEKMSAISKLNTLLCVSIIGFTFQMSARAESVDLAPLKQEVVDHVNRMIRTGSPSKVAFKMEGDVKFVEGEVKEERDSDKRGKRRRGEASSRMKSVLATKAVEMQFNKAEVLRQFDHQSAVLKEHGLGDRIVALEEQRHAVEARFTQYDNAMKRADKADAKDYEKEVDHLAKLSKELSPHHGDALIKPADTPPNFNSGRRRPREEPQHVGPPAYAKSNSMTMQGLTDVPSNSSFIQDSQLRLNNKSEFTSLPIQVAMNEYANYGSDVGVLAGLGIATPDAGTLWQNDFSAQPFISAAVTPGPSCQSTAADLDKNTPEATVTPEIAVLAQSLNYSPVKIYAYVIKNIRYEPYWGLLKGAQGTLVSGSGGPSDQTALLIALMRESGYPARYVRGTIGFYNHGIGNPGLRWIGAKSFKAATDVLIYNSNPTTREILDVSNTTGVGLEMGHVWAEVCMPYSNYRGTQAKASGFRWLPLDASFKDNTYPSDGVIHNAQFDYTSYMAKRTNVMPLEAYKAQILPVITNYPPHWSFNTIKDVAYKPTQTNTQYDVLPSSLPYVVVSYDAWDPGLTSEVASIPESHRYKLVVSVKDTANNLLLPTQTLRMSDIALKRLSLGWQGASIGEQTLLDAWKNQSLTTGAPCTGVNVRPELRLDGALLVAGTAGGVNLCSSTNQLSMQIQIGQAGHGPGPWVANSTQYSNISAANVYALHAHAYQTSNRLLKERAERLLTDVQGAAIANAPGDEILAEFLHINLLKWMRYSSDDAREIYDLDNAYPGIGLHLGVTSAQMKIDYVFDLPFAVHRTGYLIDVGAFSTFPLDLETGDLAWKDFMLAGYSASAYESYIWQETAHLDAVSTVRGLQYAKENNIEILTLNAANWTTESLKLTSNVNAALNYSSGTLAELYGNHISQGQTVTIPRSLIQYGDWLGAVYVGERNTYLSEKADFIISRYAGGFTIGQLLFWGDGSFILTEMGYDVAALRRYAATHSEVYGYIASASSAQSINDKISLGCYQCPCN
jgi:Transglutaminase-like superfamily